MTIHPLPLWTRESPLTNWTLPHDDQPVLASFSRPVRAVAPLDWLRRTHEQRFYWSSDDSATFAGIGVEAELVAYGRERFAAIQEELARLFETPAFDLADRPCGGPRVFGGFSFRPDDEPDGLWSAFPPAYFALPRYQLACVGGRCWLTVNRLALNGESADAALDEARADFRRMERALETHLHAQTGDAPLLLNLDYPLGRGEWRRQIERATARMRAGELEKVVLSRTCDLTFDAPVDPLAALDHLNAHYPQAFRFLIEPLPEHAFYGATPELMAEMRGRQLVTAALAGSAARGATEAEDDRLARGLLASAKDRHEHELVVRALREQLAQFSDNVRLPDTPTIYRLDNIQHLYTPILAELRGRRSLLEILEVLHPTPALGGTPQAVAVETIRETEPLSRGWYASPIGWIDWRGDGVFSVAIRSAVSAGARARLYAGAGIVADSEPDKEWDEAGLKFKPLLDALGANTYVRAQP